MNLPTPQSAWRQALLDAASAFADQECGVPRRRLAALLKLRSSPFAVVISGLRRCGKSTFLRQLANSLPADSFFYVNFEDPRLITVTAENFHELYALLLELFGPRKIFLLDEIQNVPQWERPVRHLIDEGCKFYITGSNASLLSQELGTRLTGRHIPFELMPFSFGEYLEFHDETLPQLSRATTVERARLTRLWNRYIKEGGIPENLKHPDMKLSRLLYDNILYRDITTRYRVHEVQALRELAQLLMANVGCALSFTKLKNYLSLGSVHTVKNHVGFLETSYLYFTVSMFSRSAKQRLINAKKGYAIDTGLVRELGFQSSANDGHFLENAVYLELRRTGREMFYYHTSNGQEVDFYLPAEKLLIQVCWDIQNTDTAAREVNALKSALQTLNGHTGIIVTGTNSACPIPLPKGIHCQQAWEWVLQQP